VVDAHNNAFKIIAWIGIVALGVALVFVVMQGDWSGVALLAAFLLASVLFVAFENRLPALFDALFVLAAIVNAAGWVWNLYKPVWGYDEFAHFYTTFAVTLSLGYLSFYAMRQHFREHRWHYVMVVASFGVTLGAWWEVVEWLILKELTDPVADIVVDSLGAFLAAGVAVWALQEETVAPERNATGQALDRANETPSG
jgi:hypothetical protein